MAQAWLAQAEKKFDQAEAWVREAIRRNPDVESGYYLLARVLFGAGKYYQLMDISEEALAHATEDYNIWVPILNACRALGREDHERILLQRELQVITRQVEKVPEDARARVLLAGDYARLGRVEEAQRELKLAPGLAAGRRGAALQRGMRSLSARAERGGVESSERRLERRVPAAHRMGAPRSRPCASPR